MEVLLKFGPLDIPITPTGSVLLLAFQFNTVFEGYPYIPYPLCSVSLRSVCALPPCDCAMGVGDLCGCSCSGSFPLALSMRTEVIGPSRPAAAAHALEKHAGRIGNALNRHGTGPALARHWPDTGTGTGPACRPDRQRSQQACHGAMGYCAVRDCMQADCSERGNRLCRCSALIGEPTTDWYLRALFDSADVRGTGLIELRPGLLLLGRPAEVS
jgi:hypothetical protein